MPQVVAYLWHKKIMEATHKVQQEQIFKQWAKTDPNYTKKVVTHTILGLAVLLMVGMVHWLCVIVFVLFYLSCFNFGKDYQSTNMYLFHKDEYLQSKYIGDKFDVLIVYSEKTKNHSIVLFPSSEHEKVITQTGKTQILWELETYFKQQKNEL